MLIISPKNDVDEKILILTANPINTKPLRLSEEIRDIKQVWERSQKREKFGCDKMAGEFFKLLRSWHKQGKNNDLWKNLRIVISHFQEIYATDIDVNCSPFNVGSSVELGEFNQLKVKELIKRHGLNWSEQEIQMLINMIDGHPYLLRVALFYLEGV